MYVAVGCFSLNRPARIFGTYVVPYTIIKARHSWDGMEETLLAASIGRSGMTVFI